MREFWITWGADGDRWVADNAVEAEDTIEVCYRQNDIPYRLFHVIDFESYQAKCDEIKRIKNGLIVAKSFIENGSSWCNVRHLDGLVETLNESQVLGIIQTAITGVIAPELSSEPDMTVEELQRKLSQSMGISSEVLKKHIKEE